MENTQQGPMVGLYNELIAGKVRGRATDFFVYSQQFVPLTASATQTQDVQIQSDSDFLLVAATGSSRDTGTGAAQTTFPFLVTLFDAGSGRNLFDRAQDWENIIGTAQRPAYWSLPKLLGRSSTLSITLQNLVATDRNVRVSFWGVKLFATNMGQ